MSDIDNGHPAARRVAAEAIDEGGLRAPPELTGWRKAWWWFDFIILVKLARLRFIGILLVIGVIITQWDLLVAYYDKWTRPASAEAAGAGDSEWFCPMHPAIVRDNGKEKCPICFMPLSKRKKGERHAEALPAGVVNRVQLSPYRLVLGGVQAVGLDEQRLTKEIKAVGFVEFNERAQRSVSARIAGRIDRLFVNETGQMVEAGAPLASIYSPDLVVTVQNLLDAKRGGSAKNQESARRRLELLGIDDAQIDEIVGADKSRTDLTIRSPISGHIIKKYVREGQYVEEGSPLYDVADLSTVWIQAQVYEDDMEFLPLGQQHPGKLLPGDGMAISVTTRAMPDEVFEGKLSFVFPHVDQSTRTLTIRCEIENPGHKLRPGSTATVTLKIEPKDLPLLVATTAGDPQRAAALDEGRVLAVPESAVIDTGMQKIVYRETVPGTFEGVRVKLGPRMTAADGQTFYPVLDGLSRGERFVVTGSFLVDAETRLNPAAGSIYFGGSGGAKSGQSAATVRPSMPEDEDAKISAALAQLPPGDRRAAEAQRNCPILQENRLGSMGPPVKLTLEGQTVFLCCSGCEKSALGDPQKTLAKVSELLHRERAGSNEPARSTKEQAPTSPAEAEIAGELDKLSDADRKAAQLQKYCVVLADSRLGSMGPPEAIDIEGHKVFICCEGCKEEAIANPARTLARLAALNRASTVPAATKPSGSANGDEDEAEIAANLAKLSPADRRAAIEQKFCVILEQNRLGSMGPPIKLSVEGEMVFVCCAGCRKKALADPQASLSKAAALKQLSRPKSPPQSP